MSAIEHALLGEIRGKPADGFDAPFTRAFHHSVVRGSNSALLASLALGLWSMRAGADWRPYRIAVSAFDEDAVLHQERDILRQAIKAGGERDARASMARTQRPLPQVDLR